MRILDCRYGPAPTAESDDAGSAANRHAGEHHADQNLPDGFIQHHGRDNVRGIDAAES